jgi:hypothetical protein
MRIGVIIAVVVVALLGWALRPVCVPLSAEDLQGFTTPIEQRTDRALYFNVFQKKGTQWHQCKTWLARQFFF